MSKPYLIYRLRELATAHPYAPHELAGDLAVVRDRRRAGA